MRVVIKIFLIIALVCSGATIAVQLLKVEPRIKNAEEARDKNAQERETQRTRAETAEGELANTKTELANTQTTLQNTQAELATKTQEAQSAQSDLQQTRQQLSSVQGEYDTWRRNHEEFVKLNRTPEQVLKTEADLKKTITERDAFTAENKVLTLNISKQDNEIIKLRGLLGRPPHKLIPPGLAGKVLAVDPKFQFVVLDVGDRQGVKVEGEMIVNRDGKLVGKVRIAEVSTDHCIANVLQDWRQKEMTIQEGDTVLAESNQ
jgi:cell shape-determining protein MreC